MRFFRVCCLVGILLLTVGSTSSRKHGRERGKHNRQSKKCCLPKKMAVLMREEEYVRRNSDGPKMTQIGKGLDILAIVAGNTSYYRIYDGHVTSESLQIKSDGVLSVYSYHPSDFCYDSLQVDAQANDDCLEDFLGYEKIRGRKYEVYSTPAERFGIKSSERHYTRRYRDGCITEYSIGIFDSPDNDITYNVTMTCKRLEFDDNNGAILQLPSYFEPCKFDWSQSFNETSNSTSYQ